MSFSRLSALLPLLLAVLSGCDHIPPSGVSATGSMQLSVHLPESLPGDVGRVTVTVSGSDMTSLSTDLVLASGTWSGVLGDIPAGAHRTFSAQAFTSSNTLRYEGHTDDVTVIAGSTGLVSLTLQDVSVPPPFTNEAPLLDSLVADPTTVAPGGTLSLTASAHDPNAGETVDFAWSAPSGSFSAPTQAQTTWTAPATPGPVALSLTVSDWHGAALTVSLTVTVSADSGADTVTVDFNTAPKVLTITSSQSFLNVGQQTTLTVSATDKDADTLSYQWSATCAGSFTGATTASAIFTPSALPSTTCNNCQLNVLVKDGRGGQNTGRLALCVSKDAGPRAPPTLTSASRSSPTATAGQVLTFGVEASDPVGSALVFSWAANVGASGTATSGANSSSFPWTAPSCVDSGTTPRIVATVSNAWGLKATQGFTVTGLPTCAVVGWNPTGPLHDVRNLHTATLLSNGKVLVAGGGNGSQGTAEVYDPATGLWSTTGSMALPRLWHSAAPLPGGKVLLVGGEDNHLNAIGTVEVYDPVTGSWSTTGALASPRFLLTATPLSNGKVLAVGGQNTSGSNLATAEVYDPATGVWSSTGALASPRFSHEATLLANGKVLVVGGYSSSPGYLATAEVYDPATGTWSTTGSMATPRYRHTVTLLANGKVLVAGGYNTTSGSMAAAEVYDPATGTWSTTGSMATPRSWHAATLLANGKVLVTGGDFSTSGVLATAEVYDPATGTWSPTSPMSISRERPTATLLANGKVLVAGGYNGIGNAMTTAEVYEPGTVP